MGRGDKRTAKGKRTRGSFGNTRVREQLKARARNAGKPKKTEKSAETPA
jgi:ribosomal small subunit protein bTHX